MQLDRLTASVRPRTTWEGPDLGFALARRSFPALWGLWWLSAMPVGVAAAAWMPQRPDLWILLLWWFKPLYEAPLLFWLSRRLFDEPMSPRRLWQERRQVLPLRFLPTLLWRRFHLSRSFQLPLIQLERLGGRARRRRGRVMQGKGGTAAWLTLICVHLESILWASALALALLLVPKELPRLAPEAALFEVESAAYWVSALLYCLAMSVMAPFYVGAGFALYLSRRAELEAWDLELAFRRAGANEVPPLSRKSAALASAALLVLTFCTLPSIASDEDPPDPEEARTLIADVLAQEDFGSKKEIRAWVYGGESVGSEGETELPAWVRDLVELFADAANLIAALAKWLLVLLAAIVGALALRRILPSLRHQQSGKTTGCKDSLAMQSIGTAFSDDLAFDAAAQARSLIAGGDLRTALALLYRASLARMVQKHGLDIPASATESQWLALVANARPAAETEVLRRLTETWQRLAYAHRRPEAAEIARLVRDWQSWQGGADEVQR